MSLLRRALLAAVLALPQAFPAARAAPHEINVFTDEVEESGEIGFEMHVNYARGRDKPDFRGELPPDKAWRIMPEFVFGLPNDWEIGLHLPAQRDGDGKFHVDGLRVRLEHLWPRKEQSPFFAGVNFEWGYDRPHLSQDRQGLELRGILGWRTEDWLVAVNPILGWAIKGPDKSSRPGFAGSLKIARQVHEGWAVGIEHYAGFGRLHNFAPRREQDHVLYLAVDYEGKGWGVNLGIGKGLTPASDDHVFKAIIGIPFK